MSDNKNTLEKVVETVNTEENKLSSVKLSNIDWRKFLDINEVSRYVDSHYSEFKTGIYIIAGTGIILTFRSLRLVSIIICFVFNLIFKQTFISYV